MLAKKNMLATALCAVILALSLSSCKGQNNKAKDMQEESIVLSSISTEDAQKYLLDKNYTFVDTRNDSYYNGFKQEGLARGGHIEGAIQYTSSWVGKVDKEKLPKFVKDKGVYKNKKIVVYDTDSKNINKVAKELKDLGYDVLAYNKLDEFSKNDENKMISFPKYEQLVNEKWVKDLIDGKKPETLENKDYMIFEVSTGAENQAKEYKKAHIKGSYHFNTDWIESAPDWNLENPKIMKKNLEKAGISKDKTIVLYSNDKSAAARVMFALKWAGVEDVRILNGGLEAWQDAKYPIEQKINKPKKIDDFGIQIPVNTQISIETPEEVIEKMGSEKLKLISIRSWDEYIANKSGYDYISRTGEVKSAIWGFAGSDSSSMQDYYDPDGTFRNPLEIAKLWEKQGIHKDDQGAFYCGTGWRAAVPWEMTQMMGWDNFVLYDGGWNMWQMDEELPVQVGAPNNMKEPDSANDFK